MDFLVNSVEVLRVYAVSIHRAETVFFCGESLTHFLMTRISEAIPSDLLRPDLLAEPKRQVAEHIIRHFFPGLTTVREQVNMLIVQSREMRTALTYADIGTVIGCCGQRVGAIHAQYAKWGNEAGMSGRPTLLTEQQISEMTQFVIDRYNNRSPVTVIELVKHISDCHAISLSAESVRHIVARIPSLKTCIGQSMEEERINCPSDAIDQWFDDITAALGHHTPACFVCNVDEVGYGGTEPDPPVVCIVPAHHPGMYVPVANTIRAKHATMIAAITADGGAVKPLIVVQRETLDVEFREAGYTSDKLLLSKSDTGYITSSIFQEWVEKCYLPDLWQKRLSYGYWGPAILGLDGCSCHASQLVIQILGRANVILKFLPAHSSDQLQYLDLGIFAVCKLRYAQEYVYSDYSRQTRHLIKIFNGWRAATMPDNVIAAFRRGGLLVEWNERLGILMAKVDRHYATKVRHFQADSGFRLFHRDRHRTKL